MRTISINQGEFKVVSEPEVVISTVLGSCVAVCLHDGIARIGGMNHFLLPQPGKDRAGSSDRSGSSDRAASSAAAQCYGVHSMELLINEMMKRGANRQRLRAHIYGGANIFNGLAAIGEANAQFARRFMEMEGIPVGHMDLGGTQARKVEFRPFDGKVRSLIVKDAPVVETPPVRKPAPQGDVELF